MSGTVRAKPGLLVSVAVVGAVVCATALVPSGGIQVSVANGYGRATLGGSAPVQQPRAGVAVRGKLPHAQRDTAPTILHLTKARSVVLDVRKLHGKPIKHERAEDGGPDAGNADSGTDAATADTSPGASASAALPTTVPAPVTDSSFAGLDFANWGAGHPPDENGDVGPTYYIQTVNTSIGIYDKSTGNRVAAFTFNAFMSQGHFGNLCDTNNFGDPVVLYDTFEDRWFISDFAFELDGSGNINPQTAYQCFAVSRTGDPVDGGWNFYSILDPGGLGDYPKFGIWPDGIYMSANMFGYAAGASYSGYHMWALDKQQMYAGAPTVQVVDFSGDTSDFTVIPANARLQTGTPPAGSPEYFIGTEEYLNAQTVYKFHVDWNKVSTSTFTGPDVADAPNCWPNSSVANASTPANALDTLQIRAMAQAQYTNQGGAESIWVAHTVDRGTFTLANCGQTAANNATIRWYQLNVTGGTVAANDVQGSTFDPDGTNTFFRFLPALAVDDAGDMAVTYTKSNATTNPQIKYAGRLASDPLDTLGQGEQTLIDGTGSQSGNCGGSTCVRWGDYAGMALDPNGCEFWMTGEYYATSGLNDQTEIGSFHYPSCTPIGNGTLSGTVTDGSNPIAGATVALGSRTTTTDSSGSYSFTVPAGTYPTLSASADGYDTSSVSSIAVPDSGTANQDFTLNAAAQSGCFTDDTQNDFLTGIPNGCDLASSPGSVVLLDARPQDVAVTDGSANGYGFSSTSFLGQTFKPTVTGKLTSLDAYVFCASCSGTNPNINVEVRATSGGTPDMTAGGLLATATIPGTSDGTGSFMRFTFGTPATLTAGTTYAFVLKLASTRTGTQAVLHTSGNPYANGRAYVCTTTCSAENPASSLQFHTFVDTGFAPTGTFVSSVKDANPADGSTPTWTTLSFSDTTPAGTSVKFQVAGSNSEYGPFSYVGPDGTASTYFTASGADLSQFDGFRYLRYEAILSTSNSSVTPTLSSVSACFTDTPPGAVALKVTGPTHATTTTSFRLNVSAIDSHGSVVTTYADPSATINDSAGLLPPGTTMSISNGVGQVTLKITQPLKTEAFTVTSGTIVGTSANIPVWGALSQFAISRVGPYQVGTPYGVTAWAEDSVGNVLYSDNGSASVSDLVGGSANGSFVNGKLSVQLTPTSPSKADTVTVQSGGIDTTSTSFHVLGPFAAIAVGAVGPFHVGTPYTVNAWAEDAAGNVLTGYSGSADIGDLVGGSTSHAFVNGKLTVQLTPTSPSKADAATVQSGGVTGTSTNFRVLGPLASIVVGAIGPFQAGTPYTVNAWAEDAAGNILSTYSGSADISDLAGGSTTGSFSNGKLTVHLTPTTARSGNRVTVTSGGISGMSPTFRVT